MQLTQVGQNIVNDLSQRYNLSADSVIHMLIAVNNGGGSMAQFNCYQLGGSGQWMRGGMTMVGDMFNNGLKNTVDNVCNELSNALANQQIIVPPPKNSPFSNQWWPAELGTPFSSGAQNNTRYAIFPQRLAVEVNQQVSIYDTLDHNIGGISQQQGGNNSLTFSSQYGTIAVNSLPLIRDGSQNSSTAINSQSLSGNGSQNVTTAINSPPLSGNSNFLQNDANTAANLPTESLKEVRHNTADSPLAGNQSNSVEIIELIKQLAQLHQAGVLSDDEFSTKKAELLQRL